MGMFNLSRTANADYTTTRHVTHTYANQNLSEGKKSNYKKCKIITIIRESVGSEGAHQ